MSRYRPIQTRTKLLFAALLVVTTALLVHMLSPAAYGAQLGNRQLLLSNNQISATSNYLLSFTLSTAGTIGSVDFSLCSNSPFPSDPCTPPTGLDATGAVLANQSGITGFSIDPASTANDIILTRAPVPEIVAPATYEFTNVVNPSVKGSYFVRIQTFATSDASGPASDYGGVAFVISDNSIPVQATVPPYLTFCAAISIPGQDCANATDQYATFGELSSLNARTTTSQLLVATNALFGYTVTIFGPTMSSGVNTINPLNITDISRPGTSQFGLNFRANSSPSVGSDPVGPGAGVASAGYNTPNSFTYNSGDTIISTPSVDITRVYTASYIVNVPSNQSPGVYVTTLTYVCLARF
jgi:hypothetical protein